MEGSIFGTFHPLALACLVRFSRTLQSWTKLTENLDPPPLMGKWCVLAFVRLHATAPPSPPPKKTSRMGKLRVLAFARLNP